MISSAFSRRVPNDVLMFVQFSQSHIKFLKKLKLYISCVFNISIYNVIRCSTIHGLFNQLREYI